MSEPREGATPRRNLMTPLWVIALFLSLTETVLGVAVTQTSGGIQVALTTFVLCFPVLVAIAFFAILWAKPYVLYAPVDYGKEVDVTLFVGAMKDSGAKSGQLYEDIRHTLAANVASNQTVSELLSSLGKDLRPDTEKRVEQVLGRVVDRTADRIREIGFLAVDSRPLLGNAGGVLYRAFHEHRTVSELLDSIWSDLSMKANIPAYTYGVRWVLRDAQTGRSFKDMGRTWARRNGMSGDPRPLKEVGLWPGMALEAISIE